MCSSDAAEKRIAAEKFAMLERLRAEQEAQVSCSLAAASSLPPPRHVAIALINLLCYLQARRRRRRQEHEAAKEGKSDKAWVKQITATHEADKLAALVRAC
jgi:hypothetical protein